jgi:hypothetical protein
MLVPPVGCKHTSARADVAAAIATCKGRSRDRRFMDVLSLKCNVKIQVGLRTCTSALSLQTKGPPSPKACCRMRLEVLSMHRMSQCLPS